MAEISLSVNVLERESVAVTLQPRRSLRDSLPVMLDQAGLRGALTDALDDCLVLISRPVERLDVTLYELGVRTGDALLIGPRARAETGDGMVLLNILRDSGDSIEVTDHTPLAEALPPLWNALGGGGQFALDRLTVWCARPVGDLRRTAEALGVRAGDALNLVQVRLRSSRVTMVLSAPRGGHTPFRINYSPAILGRFDRHLADQPLDIDLARVLPHGKERSISRRQAEFIEEGGLWLVQLHNDASVPMFVDNQRVTAERPVALYEGSVLSFGHGPNQPDFQLVVRFEAE